MSIRLKIYCLLTTIIISLNASAQLSIRDSSISFPMIGAVIGYQFPGGDLVNRFGANFNMGGVFQWKLKSNWVLGVEAQYIFGDNVKELNVIDNLLTPDGNIIDANGNYAELTFEERGLSLFAKVGRIFSLGKPNPNSGIFTSIGVGYLKHKIKIDTPGSPVPYLEDDYNKGYDRLCSGIALTEFIGYMLHSNNKLVNFYAGFEFTQAFTKNKREVNFDTGLSDNSSRVDLLSGIRLGWVIPIYKRNADKTYYY
jgi:hypothetical protein